MRHLQSVIQFQNTCHQSGADECLISEDTCYKAGADNFGTLAFSQGLVGFCKVG